MKKSHRSTLCRANNSLGRAAGGLRKAHMIESVSVELSVELGSTIMPIHQLLRMGRGAVIELDTNESDDVMLLANNVPVARGSVVIRGDRVAILLDQQLDTATAAPESCRGGGLKSAGQKRFSDKDGLEALRALSLQAGFAK